MIEHPTNHQIDTYIRQLCDATVADTSIKVGSTEWDAVVDQTTALAKEKRKHISKRNPLPDL